VETPDGEALRVSSFSGRRVLMFYEDRSSVPQNKPLRAELARWKQARGSHVGKLMILPVIDLRGLGWWPARGIALSQVHKEQDRFGVPFFVDWDGSFGDAVGATESESLVMLIGSDHRVEFAATGALTPQQIAELMRLLPPPLARASVRRVVRAMHVRMP
jgi:hypothetical protein